MTERVLILLELFSCNSTQKYESDENYISTVSVWSRWEVNEHKSNKFELNTFNNVTIKILQLECISKIVITFCSQNVKICRDYVKCEPKKYEFKFIPDFEFFLLNM